MHACNAHILLTTMTFRFNWALKFRRTIVSQLLWLLALWYVGINNCEKYAMILDIE